MVFDQSWWGSVTNVCKIRCEKLGCKKKLILLGFWLRNVGWIGFLCLGGKIDEKVKSWFVTNLGGELSQMHLK